MAKVETEFFPDAVCIVAVGEGVRSTITLKPQDAYALMQKLEEGFGNTFHKNLEAIPDVEQNPAPSFFRRLFGIR